MPNELTTATAALRELAAHPLTSFGNAQLALALADALANGGGCGCEPYTEERMRCRQCHGTGISAAMRARLVALGVLKERGDD